MSILGKPDDYRMSAGSLNMKLGGCHGETDTKTKGKSIKEAGEYLLVGRAHRRSRTGEEVPAGLLRHL
jgi:hypothetical protein